MIQCIVHTKELQGEQTNRDCWLDRHADRQGEAGVASQAFHKEDDFSIIKMVLKCLMEESRDSQPGRQDPD